MRLTMKERQSLVRVTAGRYQNASMREKGKILGRVRESDGLSSQPCELFAESAQSTREGRCDCGLCRRHQETRWEEATVEWAERHNHRRATTWKRTNRTRIFDSDILDLVSNR